MVNLKEDEINYRSVPVDEAENVEEKDFCLKPILGYVLGLLYSFSICMMNIFVKLGSLLDATIHSSIAYIIQLIVMLIFVKAYNQPILGPKSQRKLLSLRGSAGSACVILGFFGVRYLDIADIETLSNSAVIITAILSRIFLNEKLTFSHLIALIITLTGVLFIIRPSFLFGLEIKMESVLHFNVTRINHTGLSQKKDHSNRSLTETIIGVTIVLLSALFFSITQVAVRKLCLLKAHFAVVTLYPALIGLPASVIITFILIITKNSKFDLNKNLKSFIPHLGYAFCGGAFATFCNVILNYALRFEDATKIAMVKTFGVFFSFILQYFLLDITVDTFGIIGALIIITAILYVLTFKILDTRLSKSNNCFLKFLVRKF